MFVHENVCSENFGKLRNKLLQRSSIHFKFNSVTTRHGVKVLPGPRDSGTPLKFKSGTPGSPSKFKSGTPSPLFNEFIFCRIFLFFNFVPFLNKIY